MHTEASAVLSPWSDFYVIVGSASAALTGLMFVVITLIVGTQQARSNYTFAAFGTPNVIHFSAALLISALLSAPWPELWQVSILLGLCGVGGTIYTLIIFQRVRRQNIYTPVLEDWIWHVLLPFVAYIALFVSSVALFSRETFVLFIIAASTVIFLFIGIHNAWDTVTYLTLERARHEENREHRQSTSDDQPADGES
jgi:hypothetical protein